MYSDIGVLFIYLFIISMNFSIQKWI